MSQPKPTSQNLRESERQAAEMDAMRRMISASRGTCSLSVAICNSPVLRNYLTGKLKEKIETIELVPISESTLDIFNFVCEKNIPPDTAAIFITDIEKLLASDKKEHKILKALNASRELWKKNFQCPIVFWLPEYAATLLSIQAKDLWSWLSHQFEFFSEQAHISAGVSDVFAGNILTAGNLDAEQKRFRMAELEQRIREAGDIPKQELVGHILIWLNELAYLYHQIGDLAQAESMLKKSLKIDEKLDRLEGIASTYGNLGLIYRTRGELDKAEDMLKKSLEIEEKLGRLEGMANQYGNLGNVYQTRGELDKAEDMYNKSLKIDEKLGQLESIANNYGNLGLVYETRGELDKAKDMYNKSLEINEKLGRLEGIASDYGNLGNVYQIRGELDKAEDMLKKSLEINEKLGRLEGMASDYGNLGLVYRTRGEVNKARQFWLKAKKLYQQIGIPHLVEKMQQWLDSLEDK